MLSALILLSPFVNYSQELNLILNYTSIDSTAVVENKFGSKKDVISYLNSNVIKAYSSGKLAYSVDSLKCPDSLNCTAYIQQGTQYYWGDIKWGVQEGILLISGVSTKGISHSSADPDQLMSFYNRLINYYENNGYPFASVRMDSIKILNDTISGTLKINEGSKFVYDTLSVHGDLQISKSYLEQYFGVLQGEVYKEEEFASVDKKIKELPFATQIQKTKVEFQNGKAVIHVYLNKKSANFFNGVVGVLPNSPQLEGLTSGSNLLLTGDVKLVLINQLKNGEKVDFAWKRLKPETQQLDAGLSFPYLFKTPFGVDDKLALLKQDSSFINFSNQLGMTYFLSSEKQIKVFWEHKSTNVLGTEEIHQDLLGSKSNSYGIELLLEQLDYKYNPRKGIKIRVITLGGLRTLSGVEVDGNIVLDLPSDDESIAISALLPKTSPLYKFKLDMEFYVPLFKAMTIKLASKNSYIHNPYLFTNDLDRIGGFNLLRGFDEQAIFTSLYSVFTFEYRLLLEQNSFIGLFVDQAYIQNNTFLEHSDDFPIGFGASISFQTKPGIFTIMYAVGKQQGNPVSFTSAKIHFGFVSLF
jgi:hypothetical protein